MRRIGLTAIVIVLGLTAFGCSKKQKEENSPEVFSTAAALCAKAWDSHGATIKAKPVGKALKPKDGVVAIRVGKVKDGYCFDTSSALSAEWKLSRVELEATGMGDNGVPVSFERTTYNDLSHDLALYLPTTKCVEVTLTATAYRNGRTARWEGAKKLDKAC